MTVSRLWMRGPSTSWVSLMTALALGALSGPALAERHVALLVGVADYGAAPMNLKSPPVDVELLGEALEGDADFGEVIRVDDPDRTAFVQAIKRAKQAADDGVIVFYFSGHAVSVEGENYLIPAGAELKTIDDIALETVSVRQVVNAFRAARLRVVILDACRTNPFGLGGKSIGQGASAATASTGSAGSAAPTRPAWWSSVRPSAPSSSSPARWASSARSSS